MELSGPASDSGLSAALLDPALHWITRGIEIVGIGAIVLGAIAATIVWCSATLRHGPSEPAYHAFRSNLGRAILLGLEFLVAADIINTVAVDPTLQSVAVLAGIVLVRTFLSFALQIEIEGSVPWRRRRRESRPPSPDS